MEKDKESGEIENAPSAGKIKIEREEICVEGNTCSVDIEKSEYASNMEFKLSLIKYMEKCFKKEQADSPQFVSWKLDPNASDYANQVDNLYAEMIARIRKGNKREPSEPDTTGKNDKKPSSDEKMSNLNQDESSTDTEAEEKFLQQWDRMLGSHESFDRGPIEQENYSRSLLKDVEYYCDLPMYDMNRDRPVIDNISDEYPIETNIIELPHPGPFKPLEDLGKSIPGYNKLCQEKFYVDTSGAFPPANVEEPVEGGSDKEADGSSNRNKLPEENKDHTP